MKGPDGSLDDWHEQKTHYGIAVADIFFSLSGLYHWHYSRIRQPTLVFLPAYDG